MSSAISIGTTGLTASQKQMDVIGNNLANSNTLGFKAASTTFASMLNQSLSSSGSLSVGQGVAVAGIDTQFAQGSFETTGNATDLAIDGEGFFMVKDPQGATYYTRAGNFHINDAGLLVDGNDYTVQGYNTFTLSTMLGTDTVDEETDISLKNVQSSPKASTEISVGANLDETETAGNKFNVSQTVFDSKGMMHNLSINFMRTEGNGMWGFDGKLDDENTSDITEQEAHGMVFDKNGLLESMYKGDLTDSDVAGSLSGTVAATAGDGTIDDAETVINNAFAISQDSSASIVLTKALVGDGAWVVGVNGGYTAMTATQTGDQLEVDLDGDGSTDITFTLNDTWAAADTVTFDLSECAGSIDPDETILTRAGQIYQNTEAGGITLTKAATEDVWTVAVDGGYENVIAWQDTVDGNEVLKVDLDGQGGSDIVFTLNGTWAEGDQVNFDLLHTDIDLTDITFSFSDLGTGATIGESEGSGATIKNKISWDIAGDTAMAITGYASTSVIKSLSNDGYTSGVLKSLSVSNDGTISGFFTNGQTSEIGQLILADFPNTGGLKKIGNYFGATSESGEAIKNRPGAGGLGEIMANNLEISNVDVAKEFINMITAQRSYQANSRIITTADQMLTELMNIKR